MHRFWRLEWGYYFLYKILKEAGWGSVRGYLTIEAAFVITWAIYLFVFLIYGSFYLYDKCVLFQDAYAVCFRGSVQKENDGALNYINAHMKEQFGRKYFGVGTVNGSAVKTGQEVSVYADCTVKAPFSHFLTMPQNKGWKIQTQARAQISNPARIIRKCRMAENIIHYLQE